MTPTVRKEATRNRCNQRVGFAPGNRKGYCTNRGTVATVRGIRTNRFTGEPAPVFMCAACFQKFAESHNDPTLLAPGDPMLYPLAAPFKQDRNAVQAHVMFFKQRGGFVLDLRTVHNKDERVVVPMMDPQKFVLLKAAGRDSAKTTAALKAEAEAQLKAKSGTAYEALVAFAAEHALTLADDPAAPPVAV